MIQNPYKPEEILKKYDENSTRYVTAVGEKDASRLSRGKYFLPYTDNGDMGYLDNGYVFVSPSQPNPISGTDVRNILGGSDIKKAKEFFTKRAYPKYDANIFKMITNKLSENINIDIDKGDTVLMGKFKNKKVKVKDIGKDSHDMPTINGRQATTFRKANESNTLYNPIETIINEIVTTEVFNDWITNYIEEKVNPKLDTDIGYTTTQGEKKKIKARAALRLPKEHPAHVQAAKLVGADDAETQQPTDTIQPAASNKDTTTPSTAKPMAASGSMDASQQPPNQALSGDDMKSSAEINPQQKANDNKESKIKYALNSVRDKLSTKENEVIDAINTPASAERRGIIDNIKNGAKKLSNSLSHVLQHKKEMVMGSMEAIKSLATTGKIGSIKDASGKTRHWSEFAAKDSKGNVVYNESETDVLDSHGTPTGKKIKEKKPKINDSVSDDDAKLFETSWKTTKKQKNDLKHLALETAVILGSIAITGALIGGVSAATQGGGIGATMQGAASKISTKFLGGNLGIYVVKDIIKHCAFEAIGLRQKGAATGGITLGVADIFESVENSGVNANKFISNYTKKTIEVLSKYKLSDEQLLNSIQSYNKNKPKNNAIDLLKEVLVESKQESIHHFVEWATNRLKLKETPKVTLINGNEYAQEKSSLGGYQPTTKEIYVAIENRLTADILRTVAHEMAHRKQDEMGLVTNEVEDGKTGSDIENKANAVAGILMREYAKINKKIFAESINELHPNDIHFKKIMSHYDSGSNSLKKKISYVVTGNVNSNRTKIEKELYDIGHNDVLDYEKELNISALENINEASSIISTAADDAQPDGSFLPKGFKRTLGKGNGVNKSDEWFTNGGYIQIEFPEAGAIFGDEDQDQPYVIWKIKNLPRTNIKPTKFNKTNYINEHRIVSLLKEGGAYGHMSHPFDDMDLTFGDLKNIISGALNGHLELTREKTDGQALAISWKAGRLIAARNKGHLANAGANAMGIEDVASKFAGRGGLTDAYNFAMKDLHSAISGLSDAQRKKIFKEGQCFMNIEVIWPESVNVIPYGQALLVFHNTTCYNEFGESIAADQSSARILAGMIKQISANVQSKYTIQGPPIISLPKNQNLSNKQSYYFSKLNKLQSEFELSESDNVADYHQAWWENYINKKSPVKIDNLTKNALIRRWAFGDKSLRLNTISNEQLKTWATNTDKVDIQKQQKDNIKPFEQIFLGVGSDVLSFVSSVLTVHPDKAIRAMKEKLEAVAIKVKQSGDPSIIKKFKNELQRLESLGGVDKIVAAEGIVFVYNGKTYKLTGTFAPLNQLLGIFYE